MFSDDQNHNATPSSNSANNVSNTEPIAPTNTPPVMARTIPGSPGVAGQQDYGRLNERLQEAELPYPKIAPDQLQLAETEILTWASRLGYETPEFSLVWQQFVQTRFMPALRELSNHTDCEDATPKSAKKLADTQVKLAQAMEAFITLPVSAASLRDDQLPSLRTIYEKMEAKRRLSRLLQDKTMMVWALVIKTLLGIPIGGFIATLVGVPKDDLILHLVAAAIVSLCISVVLTLIVKMTVASFSDLSQNMKHTLPQKWFAAAAWLLGGTTMIYMVWLASNQAETYIVGEISKLDTNGLPTLPAIPKELAQRFATICSTLLIAMSVSIAVLERRAKDTEFQIGLDYDQMVASTVKERATLRRADFEHQAAEAAVENDLAAKARKEATAIAMWNTLRIAALAMSRNVIAEEISCYILLDKMPVHTAGHSSATASSCRPQSWWKSLLGKG